MRDNEKSEKLFGYQLAIDRRLVAGFGLGLVVFVALSIVSYKSARQLTETIDWVRHTQEVLAKLQKVNSDVIGVQTAVRGFVIAGREDFLTPYHGALRELEDDERALRQLTTDNPRQQERLTTLENLIQQRLDFSERALDMHRDGGFEASAALISTDQGKEIMKSVVAVISAFEKEERDLLAQREAQAHTQTSRTFFMLPVGTIIGLGLLLLVLVSLNAEATQRRQGEATSRRLAAEVLMSTSDAVITKTIGGIVTSWNPGAEHIFGYTADEAIGRPVLMFIPPECADEETEILARIGRGERVEHFETIRLRKDGRRANVSVTVSPLKDNTGRVVGAAKILRDITAHKQAEAALRQGEERFRTLSNSIPQLAWIASADGSIYWYNQRWYEYTGTTPEQMEGWGWQTVHDPDVLPKVLERWTGAISSGQPLEMEFPLRGADGRFRTFLTRVLPFKDADGRVVQWFGTNTDVDELKRMEGSLRASQARLSSTLAAGSIGTWTWDIVNDRLTADEFTASVFSIERNAAAKGLPANAYLSAVSEEDQPRVAENLARAIESCGRYDIEFRVAKKDGELRWLHAKGRVEADAAGKAANFHGAVIDITQRKQTDQALRESEEHFHFLNDLAEATRTLADPGEIMAVTARMLGRHLRVSRCAYADVEPDGEQFTILHDYTDGCASTVGHYQLSLFGARAVGTLSSGQTLIIRNVPAELLPAEGADMFNAIGINAIITCPLVKEGGLRAMMAVHHATARDWKAAEITIVQDVVERCWATIERRTAEDRIRRLNAELEQRVVERTAQLEEANKELEAFSYSVSHDLRAPLRTVDGFSQAVMEDFGHHLPEEARRYLRIIREGAQRMGTLIDDLLDFARLSRKPVNKRSVNTQKLVRDVIEDLALQREGRNVEIRIGDLPPCVGDPALLKQVWVNLLSNGLKYTRKRELAVLEIGCARGKNEDVYSVRDNGTGFDMRYAGKLFGVFQRLHRSEDYEGTGVGLAIVQRVIHRHGGRIWAEAAVNQGATFYFTLEGETK